MINLLSYYHLKRNLHHMLTSQPTGLFLYFLKISKNLRLSDIFRAHAKTAVGWNGLPESLSLNMILTEAALLRWGEVFLEKAVLKIYSNFTGEHTSRSLISIKLLYNFIEIILRHECSPLNLLHIFRTPFLKDTSGGLFLYCYT